MIKKKVVVVCGPTGIGKTSFAIRLARSLNGEIIGADSMQIYKYMDIGTAKPDPKEQRMARHHMIDIVTPDQEFDAGMYARMASGIIQDLDERQVVPIVAGGTGLYIKALLYGLFRTRPVDKKTVLDLEKELAAHGPQRLHERLQRLDSLAAATLHPNDGFRIIRAIETFLSTGSSIVSLQKSHRFGTMNFNALKIGLAMDRDRLYRRINQRVDLMIEAGLIKEVQNLIESGYSPDLKSMQSIGYRHACLFLSGRLDFDNFVTMLKRDTRRYAKRQLTWFRHQDQFQWMKPGDIDHGVSAVKEFLT